MTKYKITFHSEMDAKRFEDVANNNIAPILEEQLGYTFNICFEQEGCDVIMEYDIHVFAIDSYLDVLDEKFGILHCEPIHLWN